MSRFISRKAQALFSPLNPHIRSSIKPRSQIRCLSGRAVPKIADTSLWASMIPKFLRRSERQKNRDGTVTKSKEGNPAIFFMIMFTLIGSQSIRMITLRNEHSNYVRSTDAKLRLLKEVIDRIQKGENVDVKKLLGTGNEASEREWEEVLAEIEREDVGWKSRFSKEPKNEDPQPKTSNSGNSTETTTPSGDGTTKIESNTKQLSGRFY